MKNLLIVLLVLLAGGTWAQAPKKNGIIYKEHPYITIVNKSNDLFIKQDWAGLAKLYADTAIFYDPTSTKKISFAEEKKAWAAIAKDWGDIKIVKVGYPDGLQYDKDPFTVQSWWTITTVNKKTKKTAKFHLVQFDEFNKAGKIAVEIAYYDQTPLINASK
ncbi:nuclear transport factor 2 family protein [Mucilaginibacter endophyticus]|uniref:nuclear transport factor 2 family protein n=1 Tax=Mucilaginibacter endophyticus TaxID=2675003 RepID=UPI000E0CFD97|nr:nuclear transport factor 2 family protein [Mucilaginibacter endophyticus]